MIKCNILRKNTKNKSKKKKSKIKKHYNLVQMNTISQKNQFKSMKLKSEIILKYISNKNQ